MQTRELSADARHNVIGHACGGMAPWSVNGIELYYEVHGADPTLLLIPGLGEDVRLFSGVVEPLAETCRVVAFDPRGAGRSAIPPGPYSIEQLADDAGACSTSSAPGAPSGRLLHGRAHRAEPLSIIRRASNA